LVLYGVTWTFELLGLLRQRGYLLFWDDQDLWITTSHRGLLRWRGDLLCCDPPTNPRPVRVASCISAHGSSAAGCVVSRYVWATMSAASWVFGIMLPCTSTDINDKLRFHVKLLLSPWSTLLNWEPHIWVPSFVGMGAACRAKHSPARTWYTGCRPSFFELLPNLIQVEILTMKCILVSHDHVPGCMRG
jgi:hypothetical protein